MFIFDMRELIELHLLIALHNKYELIDYIKL